MRVLIIKTSSLGDVIHTLPALTDAVNALGDVRFDWVVEEGLAEIPCWHPAVDRIIPVAMRRWRKNGWIRSWLAGEWMAVVREMRAEKYDAVIDAQGLIKSALITRKALGPRYGLDKNSAREALSAMVLDHPLAVSKDQHAVQRVRQLFAQALGYNLPATPADFRLDRTQLARSSASPYWVFLHGTSWASKRYPLPLWRQLRELASGAGYMVKLPWGSPMERLVAEEIAQQNDNAEVLPQQSLSEMAGWLAGAAGVVATDTGLGHLAAALGVPQVSLYSSTDASRTGAEGFNQQHLAVSRYDCAPCFQRNCSHRLHGQSLLDPPCFETLPAKTIAMELQRLIAS